MSSRFRNLLIACRLGDISAVRRLVPLTDPRHMENRELLRRACTAGHVEIVRELLRHPSVRADRGILNEACRRGHVEIVRILIRLSITLVEPERGAYPWHIYELVRHRIEPLGMYERFVDSRDVNGFAEWFGNIKANHQIEIVLGAKGEEGPSPLPVEFLEWLLFSHHCPLILMRDDAVQIIADYGSLSFCIESVSDCRDRYPTVTLLQVHLGQMVRPLFAVMLPVLISIVSGYL